MVSHAEPCVHTLLHPVHMGTWIHSLHINTLTPSLPALQAIRVAWASDQLTGTPGQLPQVCVYPEALQPSAETKGLSCCGADLSAQQCRPSDETSGKCYLLAGRQEESSVLIISSVLDLTTVTSVRIHSPAWKYLGGNHQGCLPTLEFLPSPLLTKIS